MTARSLRRTTFFALTLAAGALLSCTGTPTHGEGPRAPGDLLTHLADDGSLLNGAFDPDPVVRLVAVRALTIVPPDDNTSLVLKRVEGETDEDVLEALAFAAGKWATPDCVDALSELVASPSARVRAAALASLAALGDDRRTVLFTSALADESSAVRRAAALGLFRLDGRRYDDERHATEEVLVARDVALTAAALTDPDPGVRWRSVYAMAGVRGRAAHEAVLRRALDDEGSPLSRVFAVRGLLSLANDGFGDPLQVGRDLLHDDDERVAIEAARIVCARGDTEECAELLATHRSPHARLMAAEALLARLAASRDGAGGGSTPSADASGGDDASGAGLDEAGRRAALSVLRTAAHSDASSPVRREARAALAVSGDADELAALAASAAVRDRERVARLLAEGQLVDAALVERLLSDPSPTVRAQALGALHDDPLDHLDVLLAALRSDDPAERGNAADAVAPLFAKGRAPPELGRAVAESLGDAHGFELDEARVSLAAALGMPPLDPTPPGAPPAGKLLDTLVAEYRAALADPHPQVLLETTKGDVLLELDAPAAPRHVRSFLELVDQGFYDGLDIHRVVPNFVVQGLDPRGDGWGTGGRRLPDEFTPTPFLTGTLGMPHAGSPHTGGCQIFITHLPTPHLDGLYTAFGRVVDGMPVVADLEVDDVILRAHRATPVVSAPGT
ncbi:MAG: peptidylprolyl isomerase [Planctomycetes bacterium]|nr:peptidylprolyl isomerase [Planctomycetota bacterium]